MRTSNHAKALFELAKEHDHIDILHFQFESFRDQLKVMPSWVEYMDSPMISFETKVESINELPYNALFLSFLKLLASKCQMFALMEIFSQWNKLVRAHLKIAHVNVFSAKPLTPEMEMKLLDKIQPTFPNQHVSLHMHIDVSLIGGLKVIYQGQALDRSVARELEELFMMI